MSNGEQIRAYYVRRWGEPAREAFFEGQGLQVEVLKFDASTNGDGVTIYATVGASAYTMPGYPDGHRTEMFIGLMPEKDEVARHLAGLALYAAREEVSIGHGHTVPSATPLWTGTSITQMLVTQPAPGFLDPLVVGDLHVEFLQATPIFDSELEYKRDHGVEGLLGEWERRQVPFWKSERRDPSLPA